MINQNEQQIVKLGLWNPAYCLNANISLISVFQCQHWPLILCQLYLYEVLQTELAELWTLHFIFIACSFIWWIITMIVCNPRFVCIINLGFTCQNVLLLSSHPAFAFSSAPSSSFFYSLSSPFFICCSTCLSYSALYGIGQVWRLSFELWLLIFSVLSIVLSSFHPSGAQKFWVDL